MATVTFLVYLDRLRDTLLDLYLHLRNSNAVVNPDIIITYSNLFDVILRIGYGVTVLEQVMEDDYFIIVLHRPT